MGQPDDTSAGPDAAALFAAAQLAFVLASPCRQRLLMAAAQGRQPVDALAAGAGLSASIASRRLRKLREARLVYYTRRGKQRLYGATPSVAVKAAPGCVIIEATAPAACLTLRIQWREAPPLTGRDGHASSRPPSASPFREPKRLHDGESDSRGAPSTVGSMHNPESV